jgi:hypothetical protein
MLPWKAAAAMLRAAVRQEGTAREGEQATEGEGEREREEKAVLASPPPKSAGRPAALPRARAKDTVTVRNREGGKVMSAVL